MSDSISQQSLFRSNVAQIAIAVILFVTLGQSVVSADSSESPVGSPYASQQLSITTGGEHSCAIMTDGALKCWGQNSSGQIGDGTFVTAHEPITVLGLTSGVKAVTAGSTHTCALLVTGAVRCWGSNGSGQLGDGTLINRSSPVDVTGLTSGVVDIAAGNGHSCAVLGNGSVKCWGSNSAFGELGDGTSISKSVPTAVVGLSSGVIAISAKLYSSCALSNNGSVKCWGRNVEGQLGNGLAQQASGVVQVSGLSSGVTAIDMGGQHACALLDNGSVKCWGRNDGGQVGNGVPSGGNSVAGVLNPVSVAGLTSPAVSITTGGLHTCVLLTGGSVNCWGFNGWMGSIGVGTSIDKYVNPTQPTGLSGGVVAVNAGAYHTCALSEGGGLKCWGNNQGSAIGAGFSERNVLFKASPTNVIGLSSGVGLTTTTSTSTTTTSTSTTTMSTSTPMATPLSGVQTNSISATTTTVGQKDISRVSSTIADIPVVDTTVSSKESSTTTALLQPRISDVELGLASVRVGEKIEMASVDRSENQMLIKAGKRTVGIAALNDLGQVQALDDEGNIRLMPGGRIRISLSGFDATAKIQTWLFSTPSLLGTEVVNADGSLTASYVLPSNIPLGEHRLAVTSQLSNSEPVIFTLGVGVGEMQDGGGVATWLIVSPLAMATFGALVIPATRRRRRALANNELTALGVEGLGQAQS